MLSKDEEEAFNRGWSDSLQRNVEGIKGSAAFIGMLSGKFDDPLQCMQFGIAVMLDKPIHLIVDEGTLVPENLKRMARSIQFVKWGDTEAMGAAARKVTEDMNNE